MFSSPYQIYQPIQTGPNLNVQPQIVMQQQQPQIQNISQHHLKVYIFEKKRDEAITASVDEKQAVSVRRSLVNLATFGYNDLVKYLTETCSLNLEKATLRYLDDEKQWIDFSTETEFRLAIQIFQTNRKTVSIERPVLKVAVIKTEEVVEKKTTDEVPQECPMRRRCHGGFGGHHGWKRGGCPYLFRKDENNDAVLELDVNFDDLKNGTIFKNLDKVEMPHYGVTCDGCQEYAFVGKRFKCENCPDFDFCSKCFADQRILSAHHNGQHSFKEIEAPGRCLFNRLFTQSEEQSEEQPEEQNEEQNTVPEEEVIVDNDLYVQEEEPIVEAVPEPVVEQPVFQMPHPLNPVQEQPISVQPYSVELSLFKEMGFFDENRSIELLKKYNGDIQRVIVDLLHN